MPNSRGNSLRTTKLTRRCSIINNFLFDILPDRGRVLFQRTCVTKETGSPQSERRKRTAVAKLFLRGDDCVVPPTTAFDEATEILGIEIAAQFPLALFRSKLPKHFTEARNGEHRKALWTRRTAGPHSTALFCLRTLRTVCVWAGTGAPSRAKLCVTMNVNESSIFINDFPLRYIPDTADFNSRCRLDMANSRTHRQPGRISGFAR
jgi:hypothetical protein